MAEQDAGVGEYPAGVLEPGHEPGGGLVGLAFAGQVQLAGLIHEAHAGEMVGDHAPAVRAAELFVPAGGGVAVHMGEEGVGGVAA